VAGAWRHAVGAGLTPTLDDSFNGALTHGGNAWPRRNRETIEP